VLGAIIVVTLADAAGMFPHAPASWQPVRPDRPQMPIIPDDNDPPARRADAAPWNQQVHVATSTDGLTWREFSDDPVMRRAGVPDLLLLDRDLPTPAGTGSGKGDLVMYTVDARAGKDAGTRIARLVSADAGKIWSQPKVVSIDFGSNHPEGRPVAPAVVQTENGRLRLYFLQPNWTPAAAPPRVPGLPEPIQLPPRKPRDPAPALPPRPGPIPRAPEPFIFTSGPQHILSAISDDGINFTLEDGVRFEGDAIADPDVVRSGDEWLMFLSLGERVILARSPDGLHFERDTGLTLDGGVMPGAVVLPDGRVRVYRCSRAGIVALVLDPKNNAVARDPGVRLEAPAAFPSVCPLPGGGYAAAFQRPMPSPRPDPIRNAGPSRPAPHASGAQQ
jgi:hypothetical protein